MVAVYTSFFCNAWSFVQRWFFSTNHKDIGTLKSLDRHGSLVNGKLTPKGDEDINAFLRVSSIMDLKAVEKQIEVGAKPPMTVESLGVLFLGPQFGMEKSLKRTGLILTSEECNRVVAKAAVPTETQNFRFAKNFPRFFYPDGTMITLDPSDQNDVSCVVSAQSGTFKNGPNNGQKELHKLDTTL